MGIETVGKTLNVSDSVLGMPNQKETPYEPFSTGSKMRRSANQAKIFDNNGGDSKADGAGVVDHNAEYGSVTYGF